MSNDAKGPLGDGEMRPGRYNMALVRRAIKNGWNVPEKYKEGIVTQMAKVVFGSEDERNKIAASKVLLEADKADQAFQMGKENEEAESVSITVNTGQQINITTATVQQALTDPEYLEFLESRALARDRDASVICSEGGAQLAAGQTSPSDQPSARSSE